MEGDLGHTVEHVGGMVERVRGIVERQPGIELAYLFGSHARGTAEEGSDLDVALLGTEPFDPFWLGEMCEQLQAGTGVRHVDVVDLSTASPLLAAEVVLEGIVVIARDAAQRLAFELGAIRRMEDTRQLRAMQQALLSERAGHGSAR